MIPTLLVVRNFYPWWWWWTSRYSVSTGHQHSTMNGWNVHWKAWAFVRNHSVRLMWDDESCDTAWWGWRPVPSSLRPWQEEWEGSNSPIFVSGPPACWIFTTKGARKQQRHHIPLTLHNPPWHTDTWYWSQSTEFIYHLVIFSQFWRGTILFSC